MKPKTPEAQAAEDAKAQAFAEAAMAADQVITVALKAALDVHPKEADGVMSGAITALTRYAIEQRQAGIEGGAVRSTYVGPPTTRDIVGYFVRYFQRAAEILLAKPDRHQS